MSEEFEKLSEIAERIDGWIAFRNDRYWNKSTGYVDQYLTGAWYAYQEQQAKIDDLQKLIDEALFEMRQLSLMLSKDIDGYEDPAQICQSEGVDMGVKILEKALRGEHENSN